VVPPGEHNGNIGIALGGGLRSPSALLVNAILLQTCNAQVKCLSSCLCVVLTQVEALNVSLSDNSEALVETQKHLMELQAILAASEHDRRILQQRLDITRSVM